MSRYLLFFGFFLLISCGEVAEPAEPTEAVETWRLDGKKETGRDWVKARQQSLKAKFLTGEEAIKKMTSAKGLETLLYASEPQITQPNAFCWDQRGRLWVAENRDYETRGKGFSKDGHSRILILEDTDGDGKMDKRKVFIEGIPFPSAIAVGFDGLWLGAVPNLLFIPDKNHDDKADDDIEVRLTGWGIRDRHEVLNSFSWGPDGWLYGCQGFATPSKVGKPMGKGKLFKKGDGFPTKQKVKDPQFIDGGIWRYHPTKDRFEVVAHGFSNPWGIDWNDKGQLFTAVCVIPHLWHVIQGGFYHRQGGRHVSPYVYEDIKTIANHRHRSAHGGIRIYLADLLPKKYRDRAVMANIHEHNVLTDILQPKGSGYEGLHGDEMMAAHDGQWVGFSVETGPEGAVYILDWHDADICGNSIHSKDTGRIYRIAPKNTKGKINLNLAKLSDSELVKLQSNTNDWYVRRARLILQQRAHEGKLSKNVPTQLWKMFESQKDVGRKLRALWALHVIKALPEKKLTELLSHPEAYVRAWSIKFICEDKNPGAASLKTFVDLAKNDRSPVVRLYLASALQRLPKESMWPIAGGLMSHAEDSKDHNIPKMIWFGIEPTIKENPTLALSRARQCKIPLVANFIVRRTMDARKYEEVISALMEVKNKAVLLNLLKAVTSARRPQVKLSEMPSWKEFENLMIQHPDAELRRAGSKVCQFFGSASVNKMQLKVLKDNKTKLSQRKEIITSFAKQKYTAALDTLIKLLDDKSLRGSSLQALSSFDDKRIPKEILNRYQAYSKAEKVIALQTLSSRKSYASYLWEVLKGKHANTVRVPKKDIPAYTVRQLTRLLGPGFKDYWGKSVNIEESINKYKKLLTNDFVKKANLKKGKEIFKRSCIACHTLYGQGGKIGPELTGSNRADLDYILLNIINPNAEIAEAYQLVTIKTHDGQVIAGNIKSEDKKQITLTLVGQEVSVLKSKIQSRSKAEISMMPEGLLNNLKDKEVRDLIGYLRTKKEIK